ncbi:SDR family oxidoreductase [Saccharothrix deserti]|uniref:SDR family oxidoreductase n=1 Tax=Saccharothrix deserti TaxID=2593674 RepID=UPI00131D30C2|nr:NAD(P)H-binding protein [Saccharothrix deserti]
MILVVGATGLLGGLIARMLLDGHRPVRILVREGSPFEELVLAGAEPVFGDVKDRASLRAACRGVDAVVTTANSSARGGADTVESVDRVGNRDLVDAAEAEGVRRFVFVSALGADPGHPVPFLRAKGETERRLRDSGMVWTVLRPNLYMEKLPVLVVGLPALAGEPVTLVGEGRRVHTPIAVRDVAAFAVAALERDECATLVLGGPQAVSWWDVVAAFARELGRDVPVRTVPLEESLPGMPGFVAEVLRSLETYDSPLDSSALYAGYGVVATSLAEFVHGFVVGSRQSAS